ncbi:MAG: TraB/GumN family protein [Fibrobacteraceae bacterium]|nr:TraB/GumN family protein [Fibrobacteraceae bacterium]
MKIKFLLLAAFLVFVSCAGVQIEKDYPCGEKHFFWKAEKRGQQPIWLLGSIHLADSSFYPLPDVIENAFEWADVVVAELDVNAESTDMETADLVLKEGKLPSGKSLENVVPKVTYLLLDSLANVWNVPMGAFTTFRPWMVAMQISAIAVERSGFSSEWGIDAELLARASDEKKKIFPLETPAEQIHIFSKSEDSLGIEYLKNTLDEVVAADSFVHEMGSAWKCGNLKTMRALLASDSSEAPFEDAIYTKRNSRMANSIDSLALAGNKIFVVIGAAHLLGEGDNVVRLLAKRGYKIERY